MKNLFNSNTGYFINTHSYWYDNKTELGYIVCQSYKVFGISGFVKLGIFIEIKEANNYLESL